jgi:hypothetical protein
LQGNGIEGERSRFPIPDAIDPPIVMTPTELAYLIRKTVVYLEFHNDDSAKELARQWQQVLDQIDRLKRG